MKTNNINIPEIYNQDNIANNSLVSCDLKGVSIREFTKQEIKKIENQIENIINNLEKSDKNLRDQFNLEASIEFELVLCPKKLKLKAEPIKNNNLYNNQYIKGAQK